MNNNNITSSLLEKIKRADADFSLFEGAEKILVGLSGGADSTSLVLSLCELRKTQGFEIYALHVNHMIRGKDADRDEEFSRALCERYNVKFFCERVDVPALSKKEGTSLELCARNVRYEAFRRVCLENGISHVATAHNALDNAETVVFNLVRGTGIRGLCGIPPKRKLCDSVLVIRPLIYATRPEILSFLSTKNESFVIDSTNSETDYTRNYIRNKIMPHLAHINPCLEESIARTARLHSRDEKYLVAVADECMTDDIEKLKTLDESILSRVVIKLFALVSEETPDEFHISMLCRRIYEYNGENIKLSMPDCLCARLYRGRLSFVKDKRDGRKRIDFCVTAGAGEVFFEENPYCLYISFDQNEDIPQTLVKEEIIYKKYTTDYLYFDTIPYVLCVRNRRDGDRIASGRMNKTVKRLMTSSPYPEDERYLVPFVCDGEKILVIPGVAVCDDCRQSIEKKQRISITLYKHNTDTGEWYYLNEE